MSDRRVPIKTPHGRLYGRDCVFLDRRTHDSGSQTLTLEGEFNGSLCEIAASDNWIPYRIQFFGVVEHEVEDQDLSLWKFDSSFDEVFDSTWVAELQSQYGAHLRHFTFQTYDDLFHIICGGYRLLVSEPGPDNSFNTGPLHGST